MCWILTVFVLYIFCLIILVSKGQFTQFPTMSWHQFQMVVSQWVTDMGRLWSDLGPIKRRETHGQAEDHWSQSEIAFQLIEFNDSLSASPVVVLLGLSYLILVEQSLLYHFSSFPLSSWPLSPWTFLFFLQLIHHPKSYLEIFFKITGSILSV